MMDKLARISVVGTSCSGKTTFARQISAALEIPYIELDVIHWKPNWEPVPDKEFREAVRKIVQKENWVIDGNYSRVRDVVWNRATTVVWLNYSFSIVFKRALMRTINRVLTRKEIFSGNRESFTQQFLSRKSILLWVINTYYRRRKMYPILFRDERFSHLNIIELKHPFEAEKLIQTYQVKVKLLKANRS